MRPIRVAAALSAVLLVAIAWYLGSPLFIRTTTNEPLPTTIAIAPTAAPAAPAASASRPIPSPAAEAGAAILRRGALQYVDALHNGKGRVLIIDIEAHTFLRFEDVSITNAPDVHVYLAKSRDGAWSEQFSTYVGPLKATDGSFNYQLPDGLDVAAYGSVVVWCRAFSVLVTWANLERP